MHGGEVSVAAASNAAPAEKSEPAAVAASDEAPAAAGELSAVGSNEVTRVAASEAQVAAADVAAATTITAPSCQNCGAPLSGHYCAACGQRHEPHIHSLREFLAEAAESITHADSRVWRTLWPLLVKPGFLTKEFLEGRRARYLPPFRLYLVLSVLFFIVAAAGGSGEQTSVGLVTRDGANGAPSVSVPSLDAIPAKPGETPEQRADRICKDLHFIVGSAEGLVDGPAVCRKIAADNGHALLLALYHNIPRALIVFLPLLALTMRVMYWRRYYVEHLLFFVHTHGFTFLFLTVYVLLIRFVPSRSVTDLATFAMMLGLPFYTYRAMRRVYDQGKWVTRSKFLVLSMSYIVLGIIMAVLLALYTAVTL